MLDATLLFVELELLHGRRCPYSLPGVLLVLYATCYGEGTQPLFWLSCYLFRRTTAAAGGRSLKTETSDPRVLDNSLLDRLLGL